jgi:surface polysaccharide O-acyltransferase-like enzyme
MAAGSTPDPTPFFKLLGTDLMVLRSTTTPDLAPHPDASHRGVKPIRHYPRLDAARVLAAYAVIWIHTPRSEELLPSVALGRFAVPFFVAASVLLLLQSHQRNAERAYWPFAAQRWHRLGWPFVAWSLLYLALKLIKKVVSPNQPNDFPGWEAFVVGTAYHLWFLPFLLAINLVVEALARCQQSEWTRKLSTAAAIMLGFVVCAGSPPVTAPAWEPLQFMWLALPSVCWAFAWGINRHHRAADHSGRQLSQTMAIMVFIASTAALWTFGRSALLETLAGLSFLVLALQPYPLAPKIESLLTRFAPLAYGVYLSHLMILKIAESVADRWQLSASPPFDLVMFSLAAFGSTTLAWLLHQSRRTRWLLG